MQGKEAVADASIVVKWFLEEEFSEKARQMRDSFVTGRITLSVPSLLLYEALNALWRSELFSEEELAMAARALHRYGFEIWEPRGRIYELTAILSSERGISVYDASYVALANHLGATLYTADEELIQKFPENTRHISLYEPQE